MSFLSKLLGNKRYNNISNEELQQIIKANKNVLILDVRNPDEYKTGHIPKSRNIPVQNLNSKLSSLQPHKDEAVIVYCASGGRSSKAATILSNGGFNKVYNLGGISNYKGKLEK